MALNDLTNPIPVPNGIDTANNNPVAKAEKVVVTGTNQSVTEALDDKEDSLGNPTTNGQVLSSQTDGTRSWVDPTTAGLPNQFLNEITEQDTTVLNTKIDQDTASIGAPPRFWFRTNLVTNANASGGAGLLVAESNGDRGQDEATYEDNVNHWNEYLYLGLTQAYVGSITLANFWVVIKNADGTEAQRLNLSTNFTNAGALGTASNTYFVSNTGGHGGAFPNYNADQTIELFEQSTDMFFTITAANEADVDITRGVKNIEESRLTEDLQAKINIRDSVPYDDQFKLDQFVETSTTSADGALTGSAQLLIRLNDFSEDSADYTTTTFDAGIPPSVSRSVTWIVAVEHEYSLSGFSNNDGTRTVTLLKSNVTLEPSANTSNLLKSYNIYRLVTPAAVSGSPTFLLPRGTEQTITEIKPTSLVKIDASNVEPDFLTTIVNTHDQDTEAFSEGLRDFNNHITVQGVASSSWEAAVNPTPHRNSVITRAFAMFWDENQRLATESGNYFSDLADPTITIPSQQNIFFFSDVNDAQNRFQGKQSYTDSTVRVNGAPLTNNFQKIISFSALIPETFTGNIVLFQAGPDNAQRVLRVAMVDGIPRLQARQGNLDGASQNHAIRRFLGVLNQDLNTAHWVGNAANTADFVVGASDPAPGSYLVQIKRYLNGAFTGGESFTQAITARGTDVAAATSTLFSSELNITHSYDAGFDNNGETVNIIRMSTNNVSNAAISYVVDVVYSVTEAVQDSSTSSFQTINDVAINREIDLVFIFEKINPNNTNANAPLQLKINVNGQSDNDVLLNIGATNFDFSDLTFGDTRDCLISNIQIYNFTAPQFFDFPTHSILNAFYQRRNDWFGLFRHPNFNSRNYTVAGNMIVTDVDGTTYDVVDGLKTVVTPGAPATTGAQLTVFKATDKTSANLSSSVTLPTTYTDYHLLIVSEVVIAEDPDEWRHTTFPIDVLSDGDVDSNDYIRVQGNTDLGWNMSTRLLSSIGGTSSIY